MSTGIFPREVGKIPVAIPRFLLRTKKKKTPSFDSPWFGLSYGAFAIVYFFIDNFVVIDSPRFPKSSGIDPKQALTKNSPSST